MVSVSTHGERARERELWSQGSGVVLFEVEEELSSAAVLGHHEQLVMGLEGKPGHGAERVSRL